MSPSLSIVNVQPLFILIFQLSYVTTGFCSVDSKITQEHNRGLNLRHLISARRHGAIIRNATTATRNLFFSPLFSNPPRNKPKRNLSITFPSPSHRDDDDGPSTVDQQQHAEFNLKSGMKKKRYVCHLHLVADFQFFKNIGLRNALLARNVLVRLINETNDVFMNNFKPQNTGVRFLVEKISILDENKFPNNNHLGGTPIKPDEFLLQMASVFEPQFRSACMGVVFTFRNFGNIVGLTLPKEKARVFGHTRVFDAGPNENTPSTTTATGTSSHQMATNAIVISFMGPHGVLDESQRVTALVHQLRQRLENVHGESESLGCPPVGTDDNMFIANSVITSATKIDQPSPHHHRQFTNCSLQRIRREIRAWQRCTCCRNQDAPADPTDQNGGSGNVTDDHCEEECCSPNEWSRTHISPSFSDDNGANMELTGAQEAGLDYEHKMKAKHLVPFIVMIRNPDVYLPIVFSLFFLAFIVFLICSLSAKYIADDTKEMKAARHTKMLVAFAAMDRMTQVYRKLIVRANKSYCRRISRVSQHMHVDYLDAISRLQTLFPHVPEAYLERVVKISANENVAVKLLLNHGYPMRTFYESMTSLKKLMKNVTIRYKK